MSDNVLVYLDKHTEGMERVFLDICPKEIDLRFQYPMVGKKGSIEEANYILATVHPVTREMMDSAPGLKLVGMPGAGFNHIDVKAAAEKGIYVINASGQNSTTTAEMTICLMLACYRRLCMVDRRVKKGEWHTFTYRHDSYELRGKTIGIVGAGVCGRDVMQRLQGWDVNIIYSDPFPMKPEFEEKFHAKRVDMETLFREADIVSLHCPLTDSTRGLVNKHYLSLMKPRAIIVNEARGAVVNEPDLIEALQNETIWGAGLDCWEKEPLDPESPLLNMEKVITTSHLGGSTREAMERCFGMCFDNVLRVMNGERPNNIVNGL